MYNRNKVIMHIKGHKAIKGKNSKKNNGGGHTATAKKPAPVNYLLNNVKMTAFKTPATKQIKLRENKGDVPMANIGSRQSTRAIKTPKKLEVTFKKTAPKSSYVPIAHISKKIEEYELLIKKSKAKIEEYEGKIAELKNKQLEADIKASKINDLSSLFSGIRF